MPTRITVTTMIARPVEFAWALWTDPAHITQWCAASDDWHCPAATNDLRTGGRFVTTMAARDGSMGFDMVGVYDEVRTHECIAYTMSDGRTCEVRFIPVEGGTRLEETFDAETENSPELQRAGWQAILDRYKAYAESVAPSASGNE
jgi:uncharacterized protein YndB with AHSA1/START domain